MISNMKPNRSTPAVFSVMALGLLSLLLLAGCTGTGKGGMIAVRTDLTDDQRLAIQIKHDRDAILAMAGTYKVSFDFEETVALRAGYELKDPYHSEADELVIVIKDEPTFISLQHILVVRHDGETHVVKHWRQDWRYEETRGYDYAGDNTWRPQAYSDAQADGAWVQSVYQVDDSPRYWGIGRWQHRDGVSTWTSSTTNRPLPRREHSVRDDYSILAAVNTHVVTKNGWVHYQHNHKLDPSNKDQPVIALESGVNRYIKTPDQGFDKAHEYWQKTAPYWQEVRAAWNDVFAKRETVKLANRVQGDTLFTHLFDLSDLYWGKPDASAARPEINTIINAFMQPEQVAQP